MDLFELIFDNLWKSELDLSPQGLTADADGGGNIQSERHFVGSETDWTLVQSADDSVQQKPCQHCLCGAAQHRGRPQAVLVPIGTH